MGSILDDVTIELERLRALREGFVIRAALLPADLTVLGLLEDLLDAVSVAVQLCKDNEPIAAFPLARTAFEAGHLIIVLATADDYVRVGARAWLYYHRKDMKTVRFARGAEAASEWFESVRAQLLHFWSSYNPEAGTILTEENARLEAFKRGRQRDNFMGEDLPDLVEGRYPKLATVLGQSVPRLRDLNRGIWAALSHESHARLRVDPMGLEIGTDGTVRVIPRKVDKNSKREIVLGCLDSSLSEATAAVDYLLKIHERQRAEELHRLSVRAAEQALPSNFRPDLGLHLMRHGGASTTFHFPRAPIHKLGILPNGTVTWASEVTFGDQEFCATFDVPGTLVADLAQAVAVELEFLRPKAVLVKHTMVKPRHVHLECKLGEIQKAAAEAFVPLVAVRVAGANPRAQDP